jgi:hypothetical protein
MVLAGLRFGAVGLPPRRRYPHAVTLANHENTDGLLLVIAVLLSAILCVVATNGRRGTGAWKSGGAARRERGRCPTRAVSPPLATPTECTVEAAANTTDFCGKVQGRAVGVRISLRDAVERVLAP